MEEGRRLVSRCDDSRDGDGQPALGTDRPDGRDVQDQLHKVRQAVPLYVLS